MAVNLVNSDDIEVTQTGDNIQLNTKVNIQTLESNIETNTNNIENLRDYVDEEIENIRGKILWTNPSPTTDFTAQTVTLSETIDNFDSYAVVYYADKALNTGAKNSGILPKSAYCRLEKCYAYNYWRIISLSGTSATISAGTYRTSYGGGTNATSNSDLIPLYIIGYNTGLFYN